MDSFKPRLGVRTGLVVLEDVESIIRKCYPAILAWEILLLSSILPEESTCVSSYVRIRDVFRSKLRDDNQLV